MNDKANETANDIANDIANDKAVLIDVRSPMEFAAGHLPQAINVPYDRIQEIVAVVGQPAAAPPLVLYCQSGTRSMIACTVLRQLGFQRLTNAGGIQALAMRLADGETF